MKPMKTVLFSLCLLVCGLSFLPLNLSAQKSKVQSAANAWKGLDYDVAKKYIDEAAASEITANDYKMWYYRAEIYWAIHDSGIHELDSLAVEKGAQATINCMKTDVKKWYVEETKELLLRTALGLYNKSAESYSRGQYKKSVDQYELLLKMMPYDKDKEMKRLNIAPPVIIQNLYYSWLQLGEYEKAKGYLLQLMDMNFQDPNIYISMAFILLRSKTKEDTAKALGFIEDGREKFEDDVDLMGIEIEFYIWQKNTNALIEKITAAIDADPQNEILLFNRAYLYEKRDEVEKAELDYVKALEIDPGFFDASYNLGMNYYSRGVEIHNEMGTLPMSQQAKFDAFKAKRDDYFNKALPYLVSAFENNTEEDVNTMIALKEVYAKLGMYDKSKIYKEKIIRYKQRNKKI